MPNIVERFEAVVTSVDDPENRGRFKVKCVGLMGDLKTDLPFFVELVPDWGWFVIPEVGEQVEIEVIVATDRDEIFGQATVEALNPVWRGKRFITDVELDRPPFPIPGQDDDGSVATPPHDDLVSENYGLRRGWSSPHGLLLMFDDKEPRISLLWVKDRLDPGEAPDPLKSTRVEVQSDGSFVVKVLGQHTLTLGADGKFKAELGFGTSLVVENNGSDATLNLGDGARSVAVAEPLKTIWDAFEIAFNTHVHSSGVGPTGTPTTTAPSFDADIISNKMKLPAT